MNQFKKILYLTSIIAIIIISGTMFAFFKKSSTMLSDIPSPTSDPITPVNSEMPSAPLPDQATPVTEPTPKKEIISDDWQANFTGPTERTFTWNYAGRKYTLTQTLFNSLYTTYQTSTKDYIYQGSLAPDWEEAYYGMFLLEKVGDKTLAELTEKIRTAGEKNSLNENQIVELTVNFAQAIVYDKEKAALINAASSSTAVRMRYPYEVLYDQTGVCSGKSLLLHALLSKLGYGVALFVYDSENHLAVGIRCTDKLSTYASGYCYTETTAAGMNIGVIPTLDLGNNQALAAKEMNYYTGSNNLFDEKRLSAVRIIQKTDGKIYAGIASTIADAKDADDLKKEIDQLSQELSTSNQRINKYSEEIEVLEKKMNKLKQNEKYAEYNSLVDDYNDLVKTHAKEVKKYNETIKKYNAKVNNYNNLVKSLT